MKRFILFALVVTMLFVGGYMAWTNWLQPRPTAQVSAAPDDATSVAAEPTIVPVTLNKDGVPESIGSLKLVKSKLGKDALDEFAQLHGQGFDLVGGYRADYADGDRQATLWVGQAKDAAAAEQLVKEMGDKIGAGNPMFTDLQEMTISGRTLYEVKGQGQLHFFYAANDKIIWLAASAEDAPNALHSMWRVIQ